MSKFEDFLQQKEENELLFMIAPSDVLTEDVSSTRYSIEINYRSNIDQVLEAFAKIALGFVSAGIKNYDFHVKHVYTEDPIRILISSRTWHDDGSWVGVVSWNKKERCFYVGKGFYNKDRKTVSLQDITKCDVDNAAEITKKVYNVMRDLKGKPDKHLPKLKGISLKRGPKK